MTASFPPDERRVRWRIGAGAVVVLGVMAVAAAVLVTAVTPHGVTEVVSPGAEVSASPAAQPGAPSGAQTGAQIYVHILGQVAHPGLYSVRDGARAVDVVAAAGGFTPEADPAGLNLARFLSDGEQIVVPAVGEAVVSAPVAADGTVDLNTADSAALETLPRIGPALAARILAWRDENTRFSAVEDLLDVPGIGSATFEGLRDLVTV